MQNKTSYQENLVLQQILSSNKSKPYVKSFNYFCKIEIFNFCGDRGAI